MAPSCPGSTAPRRPTPLRPARRHLRPARRRPAPPDAVRAWRPRPPGRRRPAPGAATRDAAVRAGTPFPAVPRVWPARAPARRRTASRRHRSPLRARPYRRPRRRPRTRPGCRAGRSDRARVDRRRRPRQGRGRVRARGPAPGRGPGGRPRTCPLPDQPVTTPVSFPVGEGRADGAGPTQSTSRAAPHVFRGRFPVSAISRSRRPAPQEHAAERLHVIDVTHAMTARQPPCGQRRPASRRPIRHRGGPGRARRGVGTGTGVCYLRGMVALAEDLPARRSGDPRRHGASGCRRG
jgi:hypothetical protein